MRIEDERVGADPVRTEFPGQRASGETDVTAVRIALASVLTRLTRVESDLAALKTGLCIVETRLTGIENRQLHAKDRRERLEARCSELDFGVDRVQCELVTLKDRMRCVELDLREASGAARRPRSGAQGAPGPVNHAVGRPVGFPDG